MKQILQYEDADGNITYSRLGSWLAWREQEVILSVPRNKSGICTICEGYGIVRSRYGPMRCFCEIESETIELAKTHKKYQSSYAKKSMDDFVTWGSAQSTQVLENFHKLVYNWSIWPDSWLTIIGQPGTGKSHVLAALAEFFGPWALYITATDFDAWLHRLMDSDEDGTMTEFLDAVKTTPILLFDDLGSEYVKTGVDWLRSNLRKVIDFRYLRPKEFPTVVTTNLNRDFIMQYDMRIGSRILDVDNVDVIELAEVGDYRRRIS